jgi:hypothetical protein
MTSTAAINSFGPSTAFCDVANVSPESAVTNRTVTT